MNPRLETLLNRWLDGELEEAEAAAVQKLLVEDREARQVYYQLLMVDKILDEQVGGNSALGDGDDVLEEVILFPKKKKAGYGRPLAIAAAVALMAGVGALFFFKGGDSRAVATTKGIGPSIARSSDSRITIAQRQDGTTWNVGELLRLERGTAAIRLNDSASANIDGPAAVELLDKKGNIRLLEGMASFDVRSGGKNLDVQVPGGVLRDMNSRYTVEVLPDGKANLRVESGFLEVRPRRVPEPVYLKKGEAIQLEANGETASIRLPDQHFRSGLPEQVVLFRDNFNEGNAVSLVNHRPQVGDAWRVPFETNPTVLKDGVLDTSSGARRLVAPLAPHKAGGVRSVYIFSFKLVPPSRIDDKVNRKEGVESISLVDSQGNDILSVVASAAYGHRWQLRDERTKASTAVTPVCALWTHSLTLCYGLDGRATLHDGASAQAPVIAELRVAAPSRVGNLTISNRNGGDLAFRNIETLYLPDYTVEP